LAEALDVLERLGIAVLLWSYHKDHQEHKGHKERALDGFYFVTFVAFVIFVVNDSGQNGTLKRTRNLSGPLSPRRRIM
jgi:hypothetical protein